MGWLDHVPSLRGLAAENRRQLDQLRPMEVPAGTVLFQPGDSVKGYVIVLTGRIGVHLIGPSGRDILLYDVVPGKSCIQSTLGLLGGDDYSAEAVAELPSTVVLLPRDHFLRLIDTDPAFRTLVFSAFAERMQAMMHLLERVAFQRVEARLAAFLLRRADDQGIVRITQQDLASAIGSAREVVSRRLDALARRGLASHERGEVTVLDRPALTLLADEPAL